MEPLEKSGGFGLLAAFREGAVSYYSQNWPGPWELGPHAGAGVLVCLGAPLGNCSQAMLLKRLGRNGYVHAKPILSGMCSGELQMQHHAKTTHPKGKSKLHEIRGQPRDERWRKERRGKSSLLLEEQTKNEQERHQTLGVQGRASTPVGQGEADDS